MNDRELAIALRASLIRQAALLQEHRATVLEQVAALEQRWLLGKHSVVQYGKSNKPTSEIEPSQTEQ